MAAVLPEANFERADTSTAPAGQDVWSDLDVTTADDAALEPHLPLDVMVNVPRGTWRNGSQRLLARAWPPSTGTARGRMNPRRTTTG